MTQNCRARRGGGVIAIDIKNVLFLYKILSEKGGYGPLWPILPPPLLNAKVVEKTTSIRNYINLLWENDESLTPYQVLIE